MTKTEIKAVAKSIIKKVENRGGNDNLRPRVTRDGIAVDYRTDCDRMGYVENTEEDYLVGLPRETCQAVVDAMKEILEGALRHDR